MPDVGLRIESDNGIVIDPDGPFFGLNSLQRHKVLADARAKFQTMRDMLTIAKCYYACRRDAINVVKYIHETVDTDLFSLLDDTRRLTAYKAISEELWWVCEDILRAFIVGMTHPEIWKAKRSPLATAYRRDGVWCRYCGAYTGHHPSYDLVVPADRGGKSTASNLVTACELCYSKKNGRTLAEAGLKLLPPGSWRDTSTGKLHRPK